MGIIKMTMNYIRLDTNKTTKIKKTIYSWFKNYNPQYFLSIQFPKCRRSVNLTKNEANLRQIMSNFEKILLGRHWNRKHIPFVAIAEQGKSIHWHYHVLIYDCPFDLATMQSVTQAILIKQGLPHETLHIETVFDAGVNSYSSKEFKADIKNHFDSDRIITSEILFDLAYKPISHITEMQKQHQD